MNVANRHNADQAVGKLIFGAFGVGAVALGFRFMRRYRRIQDTPTSRVATAAQGLVELSGVTHCTDSPMINSLGQAVAYRKFDIEEMRRSSKGSTSWHTIDTVVQTRRFYLADATGLAEVKVEGFDVVARQCTISYDLYQNLCGTGQGMQNASGAEIAMAVVGAALSGIRSRRVIETSIVIGEPLFLLGSFRARGSSDPSGDLPIFGSVAAGREGFNVLTTMGEKRLVRRDALLAWALILGGAAAVVGAFTLD